MPEKFNNKTNGVSHRRFLAESNPALSGLITGAIGDGWLSDMSQIDRLTPFASDPAFLEELRKAKRKNKEQLARYILEKERISVDPDSIFDVQVKRIHAYKRQLLNILKIVTLYNEIKADPNSNPGSYTFLFAGKAAAGYLLAKEIIKFICSVADLVNADPAMTGRLRVVFLENFNVSLGQIIYPAADLSEQISTAGKEASGTGNMKFMMNGAVTLGTLDGANIEIRDRVGAENICIFGLKADEVERYVQTRSYIPTDVCRADPRLQLATDQMLDGFYQASGTDFRGIYNALLNYGDEYFVLKDFASYMDAWRKACSLYGDRDRWARMSLMNTAKSGYFSSDRTIAEYAREIWRVTECQ